MAASPAIDLGEPLAALFKRARVADSLYRRYEGRLAELGIGDAGDLLDEVAEKGIGSLDIHDRQAEKLRQALLGRRGWGDAAAVLASLSGLSLGDTPAGVAAGDQAAGGGAAAGGEGRGGARPEEADGGACDAQAAEGGSGGGTEGSSLDPLEPALPESGDGTIAAAGGEEEVEGGRKAPRRRRGRRGRGARGRGGGLEKVPDTAAGLAAGRPNPVEEVSTGGAAPAEGEEGGPPSLAADDPGRAHFARPPACMRPSSSRTAPALRPFSSVTTGLSTAGGAAAAAEAGGGAPRSPTVLLGEDGRPCSAEEAEEEARRRGWSAREAAVVMECRLIEAGGGGRCSARWLELDAIAARLRRDLGDSDPGAYPIDFFLSRLEGFGARGAAAEAAFRRLSVEERDEVVAALVAEFQAGERERLRCWHAGRGSVGGVPFIPRVGGLGEGGAGAPLGGGPGGGVATVIADLTIRLTTILTTPSVEDGFYEDDPFALGALGVQSAT